MPMLQNMTVKNYLIRLCDLSPNKAKTLLLSFGISKDMLFANLPDTKKNLMFEIIDKNSQNQSWFNKPWIARRIMGAYDKLDKKIQELVKSDDIQTFLPYSLINVWKNEEFQKSKKIKIEKLALEEASKKLIKDLKAENKNSIINLRAENKKSLLKLKGHAWWLKRTANKQVLINLKEANKQALIDLRAAKIKAKEDKRRINPPLRNKLKY